MLFSEVRYYLSESIPADKQEELGNDLNTNGAKRVRSLDSCTHVITNSSAFEGYKEVGENVKVVSVSQIVQTEYVSSDLSQEAWVSRSVELGKLQK